MVVVMVAGLTLLVTAGHDLVLQVNATPARGNLTQEIILGIDTLLAGLALLVLWLRRRSVLDLWLMILMCAFIIEIVVIRTRTRPRGSALVGIADASSVSFPPVLSCLYCSTRRRRFTHCLFRALVAERRERTPAL